jgi:hypothetical protein
MIRKSETCRAPRPRLAAIALLALAGCAHDAAPPGAEFHSVTLALEERGKLDYFRLTPLRVLEDSRCPAGTQCIQAGTVRLALRIEDSSRRQQDLTLAEPFRIRPDAWLILCTVTPARPSRSEIAPGNYRFRFALAKVGPLPPLKFCNFG